MKIVNTLYDIDLNGKKKKINDIETIIEDQNQFNIIGFLSCCIKKVYHYYFCSGIQKLFVIYNIFSLV